MPSPGFQPAFCGDESLRFVGTDYSLGYPQSQSPQDSLQDGDPSVCASVCAEQRLDGVHRLEGLLLASSIHPDNRKYLRFVTLNQVFQFKALVSASPWLRRFSHGSWLWYSGGGGGGEF